MRWQEQQVEKLVGPGRAGPKRHTRVIQYRMAKVSSRRKPAQIQAYEAAAGWRAYGTNAPRSRLTVQQAVEKYAGQWQPERGFGRLKGGWLKVAPVFLRTDEHICGLMFILSLYDGAPNKTTDRPTTERLLNAFQGIPLLRIRIGHEVQYQLSGFSKLHRRILQLLGLPASLYTALESSP